MQVTDADKAQINRLLGELLELTIDFVCNRHDDCDLCPTPCEPHQSGKLACWHPADSPAGCSLRHEYVPPDFFTDATAADRLIKWLEENEWDLTSEDTTVSKEKKRWRIAWWRFWHWDGPQEITGDSAADWKAALALACVERTDWCNLAHRKCEEGKLCDQDANTCGDRIRWRIRKELVGYGDSACPWRIRKELVGYGDSACP